MVCQIARFFKPREAVMEEWIDKVLVWLADEWDRWWG